MKTLYKKAVLIFGIIIPVVIMVIVALFVTKKANALKSEFAVKEMGYNQDQGLIKSNNQLQAVVNKNSESLKIWKESLENETRGTFIEHWKLAEQKFTERELRKISHNWVNTSSGIGQNGIQPASQIKMKFEATFKAMQLSLLELETKLPQLQLDQMSMKTDDNSNLIQFETTFTLWAYKK